MMTLHTQQLVIQRGVRTLCQSLDICFKPGEIWGLLGPNGSGKTSLLHTLAGLHPCASGSVYLDHYNVHHTAAKTVAQHIALLFQDSHFLFPQTVWDYCAAARFPHLHYFKKLAADDHAIIARTLLSMELNTLQDKNILQLSGGEKRRLALAAVLAQTPAIYLLDEPTNHLDMRHQALALRHFQQLAANHQAAICMSLHDVNLAQQYCTHLLMLFPDGRTVQGTTNERLTSAVLSELYACPISPARQGTNYWQHHLGEAE